MYLSANLDTTRCGVLFEILMQSWSVIVAACRIFIISYILVIIINIYFLADFLYTAGQHKALSIELIGVLMTHSSRMPAHQQVRI